MFNQLMGICTPVCWFFFHAEAASGNKLNYWLQQELLRLFQRAGVAWSSLVDWLIFHGDL